MTESLEANQTFIKEMQALKVVLAFYYNNSQAYLASFN